MVVAVPTEQVGVLWDQAPMALATKVKYQNVKIQKIQKIFPAQNLKFPLGPFIRQLGGGSSHQK